MDAPEPTGHDLIRRRLEPEDAAAVQRSVAACPPLTLHTPYTYWVMLGAQPGFCVGAFATGEISAFVLAVRLGSERLFVWQIGVLPAYRGRGLGAALLADLWTSVNGTGIESIETTIAPGNTASRTTFERFANRHGMTMTRIGEAECVDRNGLVAEAEDWFKLRRGFAADVTGRGAAAGSPPARPR